MKNWWKHAVIYQIYPRSFLDTNHDGIGDLNGITQKIDYIASLGVDGIWISPFFPSPMKDFGYDVSDYRGVDPMFGTLDDFDALLAKAHSAGLKVIIDLVLSHTSDQHPWFSDPTKKDWYVWADAKADGAPPNNWASVFGGSAWEWNDAHQQYYLHNFLTEQPDLNCHNPAVQNEIFDICKFWLDRGVDGFRLDVVNFYFHDQKLRDNPPSNTGGYATQFEGDTPYSAQAHIYDKSQPENLEFIEKLRALTDTYENRVLIGEIGDDAPNERAREYTNGDARLHTAYNTSMMAGTQKTLHADIITNPLLDFFECENLESAVKLTDSNSWPAWAFSNHDVVRAASRWFKPFDHNPNLSKMLIALLGCLPGTLFLYQGEELGLPEAEIPFDSLQDPWAKETWPEWQGRDGCRTPMPWLADSQYLGFSNHKPWLPIPKPHKTLSIEQQELDKDSVLHFTQKFINWRKKRRVFLNSSFQHIETKHLNIIEFSWFNVTNETRCIFNLSDQNRDYNDIQLTAYGVHIDGFNINEN